MLQIYVIVLMLQIYVILLMLQIYVIVCNSTNLCNSM